MVYNPRIHHRRSIRLKGYDYLQAGLYFITICTQNRACLFGEIKNGKMILNEAGRMVDREWMKLTKRFSNVKLHEFVTMPNHFHSILQIVDDEKTPIEEDSVGVILEVAPETKRDLDELDRTSDSQPLGVPPEGLSPRKRKTVGDMVGAFQSIATVEYIRGVNQLGWKGFNGKLWQRNYWEHIIRNELAYHNISQYIINNPAKWEADKFSNK